MNNQHSGKSKRIPLAVPYLRGREKEYVLEALESSWISSIGKYISAFEAAFAEFCSVKHAISVCNGTAALHTALLALGTASGDEVIVPSLTFISTVNAVTYCGATPVFAEAEYDTGNIDPQKIEDKITSKTKGIIAVHLYGHPAQMDTIKALAQKHRLWVLEDAAEAHGALYKGQKAGSLGDAAIFSFFGNKIITTGEGGMITTNNDEIARMARLFKGQGQNPQRRYWFDVIGYNYRMTNIQAALGLAQLEQAEYIIQRHRRIAQAYNEKLKDLPGVVIPEEKEYARSVYWLYCLRLKEAEQDEQLRDAFMSYLEKEGIETRPFFYPAHILPPYRDKIKVGLSVTERLSRSGVNLPLYAGMEDGDIDYITDKIRIFLEKEAR